MRLFFIISLFLFFNSCSSGKSVYWCGDHACINNKEKEAYFKKTMIVEKKIITKENRKELSNSEKIIKKAKLEEKKRIKNEKELAKQAKLKERRLKKEKKELAKQARLEEKKIEKEQKKLAAQDKKMKKILKKKEENMKKVKTVKIDKIVSYSSDIKEVEFEQIKDQIIKKNLMRPYPDINDIPN